MRMIGGEWFALLLILVCHGHCTFLLPNHVGVCGRGDDRGGVKSSFLGV